MAVLAMDAYGWLLADLCPHAVPVRGLAPARRAATAGRLPVLLPFELVWGRDELPHTWAVTSDSIAVWVAAAWGAQRVVLLKDVDGIHTARPGSVPAPALLAECDPARASALGAVDGYLAEALTLFLPAGEVWVAGGTDPAAVTKLILSGTPTGTRVVPRRASA